jgi:hypothetical protein
MIVVFAVLPALGGLLSLWIYLKGNAEQLLYSVGLLVFAVVVGFSFRGAWGDWRICTIVPYFERKRGGPDPIYPKPYNRYRLPGSFLAINCQRLDELTVRLGVKPISYFGFNDDLRGEELHWHDANEGLATLDALLAAVSSKPLEFPEGENLLQDMEGVRFVLKDAVDKGIRFCFLLREGEGRSGAEDETRTGSMW